MKKCSLALFLLFFFGIHAFANVTVNSPANHETVSNSVHFAATGNTSTCSSGVASMGVYVDDELIYVVAGSQLDTTLTLLSGAHKTTVEAWDFCGGATFTIVPVVVSGKTGVWVTSPAANSTVPWLTNYVATATTACPAGVAAMGIYVDNQLTYIVRGAKLNTQMNLSQGRRHTVVEQWDNCGGASYTTVDLNVTGSGNKLSNIQASKGWNSWGQLAPTYEDCPAPCSGIRWAMRQNLRGMSTTGTAARFDIQGLVPYADVLWSNPVLGQFSTQGQPDNDHTLLPKLHNFTYDAYFYVTDASVTQVLEFDISMYMNGAGMIWGNQCRIAGGHEWDIWDNVNGKWVPTGVACNPVNHGWNHVTIQAQRGPNNTVLFQSITLNGTTANINKSYAPFSVPQSWWGVTVNYQMDGDLEQHPNTTYLDNFSLTYW